MAQRKNPFKRHRFPREIILLAVRWYCRYPLSCRDVRDMLAERGVTVDASTIHHWVLKFGPEIRKRAYGVPMACGRNLPPRRRSMVLPLESRRPVRPVGRFSADRTAKCQGGKGVLASGPRDGSSLPPVDHRDGQGAQLCKSDRRDQRPARAGGYDSARRSQAPEQSDRERPCRAEAATTSDARFPDHGRSQGGSRRDRNLPNDPKGPVRKLRERGC